MSDLVHCIYVSTASPALGEDELRAMLQVARRNNARSAITGILLASEGTFFQVLEGHPDQVAAVYEKIAADPRHSRVTRIIHEPLPRRFFGEWSMGFASLTPGDLHEVAGANDFFLDGHCFDRLDLGRTKKLLDAFRQGRWRARVAGAAPAARA